MFLSLQSRLRYPNRTISSESVHANHNIWNVPDTKMTTIVTRIEALPCSVAVSLEPLVVD